MRIVMIEPFYGGSHKYFADGLVRHSRHEIRLETLPGRFWKWRMESAGMELAGKLEDLKENPPDLLLAGNLLDLMQFKAALPLPGVPHVLYVHENQLDYPLNPGEKRDFHYVWKDYCNYRAADRVVFNSVYNRDSFINGFDAFRSKLPDCKPRPPREFLPGKSKIITPGCYFTTPAPVRPENKVPVIIWNHRWEHDKNPEAFFRLLDRLKKEEKPFQLILLGESYAQCPTCFTEAKDKYKEELIHYGYAESRERYEELLQLGDIVISTSLQENFGISAVEAMSAGALPLLPDRLAYPEVLPKALHTACLYQTEEELYERFLALWAMDNRDELRQTMLREIRPYAWPEMIKKFDDLMDKIQEDFSENL